MTVILHTNFKVGLLENYFLASRSVCETLIHFQVLVLAIFCYCRHPENSNNIADNKGDLRNGIL